MLFNFIWRYLCFNINRCLLVVELTFGILFSSAFVKALPFRIFFPLLSLLSRDRMNIICGFPGWYWKDWQRFGILTIVWQLKWRLSEGYFQKAQVTKSIVPCMSIFILTEPDLLIFRSHKTQLFNQFKHISHFMWLFLM